MSKSIPLIHKTAAIEQIVALGLYEKDVWPVIYSAQLPIHLDSSSANFVPFSAFCRMLQIAFERLSSQNFIAFIQRGAQRYSANIETTYSSKQTSTELELLSCALPIQHAEFKRSIDINGQCQLALEIALADVGPYQFVSELYALCVAHHFLTQRYANIKLPAKYHLVSQDKGELDKLHISTGTPQYMGQGCSAIFYALSLTPATNVLESNWESPKSAFSSQVSDALEGYIGRQDLSLNDFSRIVAIPPRTIQRHLKKNNSSYRKIKELLNIEFAKRVMIERNASISDISGHLGYADPSQFVRAFKRSEKTTPLQWCKQVQQSQGGK